MAEPHQTLKVPHGSSPDEIKRAFRRQAMKYHPDRAPTDPNAGKYFHQARQAYEEIVRAETVENIKRAIRNFHAHNQSSENICREQDIACKPCATRELTIYSTKKVVSRNARDAHSAKVVGAYKEVMHRDVQQNVLSVRA